MKVRRTPGGVEWNTDTAELVCEKVNPHLEWTPADVELSFDLLCGAIDALLPHLPREAQVAFLAALNPHLELVP